MAIPIMVALVDWSPLSILALFSIAILYAMRVAVGRLTNQFEELCQI